MTDIGGHKRSHRVVCAAGLGSLPASTMTGLQNELVLDPELGDLIKGGCGIRKLRHAILRELVKEL